MLDEEFRLCAVTTKKLTNIRLKTKQIKNIGPIVMMKLLPIFFT